MEIVQTENLPSLKKNAMQRKETIALKPLRADTPSHELTSSVNPTAQRLSPSRRPYLLEKGNIIDVYV